MNFDFAPGVKYSKETSMQLWLTEARSNWLECARCN